MSGHQAPAPGRPPLTGVLVVSLATAVLVVVAVLGVAGGWDYYSTPLRVRAYHPAHHALRPSGTIGLMLGSVGFAMMTMPVLYAIRKRWPNVAALGGMKGWLDAHVFCGTVGPVLVTLHTATKFNGVVSVAYWSMVAVMLSGFVGRYLYVRIPRSLRGAEMSYAEIEAQAAGMLAEVAAAGVAVEHVGGILGGGGPWSRGRRGRLQRHLVAQGLDEERAAAVVRVAAEREVLLRRLGHLSRTRRLFAAWHVFHLPLVYVMFAIVLFHIALAVYLGYASFLQR